MAQQQRNGVFYAVRAEMFYTKQVYSLVSDMKWVSWECRWGRWEFGNPEGERPPFDAATKQRLVKTVTEDTNVCVTVNCGL
jgi:hypothetical protein